MDHFGLDLPKECSRITRYGTLGFYQPDRVALFCGTLYYELYFFDACAKRIGRRGLFNLENMGFIKWTKL
ncbi:MAG: hypothetical protein KBD82_01655 [Rhodoferax sp.]|uniref:hypothetical protein n=1 Tax=Rhodoferax sp. TaxID=50421 RepID=UPI001B62E4BE|nr:hypothetical protein [Rhodoferax sp.]MBP9734341.1 hypothetical protein [Rhodoferax sp.]